MTDDRGLYERMVLEGFQSGLSWLTILRKRENFRAAFAGFEIDAVARFDDRDVARLLADAGIVRHRGKIEAAIANAVAARAMRADGESLAELIWSYAPSGRRRAPRSLEDLPGDHARVDRAEQGPEEARLPLRRPHHRLRDDAGVRRRERPHRRLLGPAEVEAGARQRRPANARELILERRGYLGWMNALSQSA